MIADGLKLLLERDTEKQSDSTRAAAIEIAGYVQSSCEELANRAASFGLSDLSAQLRVAEAAAIEAMTEMKTGEN